MRTIAIVVAGLLAGCGRAELAGQLEDLAVARDMAETADAGTPSDLAAARDLARFQFADMARDLIPPPPADLSRPARRAFIAATLSGDLGGKVGADAWCQRAADAASDQSGTKITPLGGRYVAVLWYGTEAPADYLVLGGRDVVNLDGRFVSRDEDFLEGPHAAGIDCTNRQGWCKQGKSAWTGYKGQTCNGWTSKAVNAKGDTGSTVRLDAWRGGSEAICDGPGPYIYCLEQ